MPKVHGGILEKLEGENYKIIVDDAFKWLKTYKFVDVFIFIFHKKKIRGTFFFFNYFVETQTYFKGSNPG